MKTRSCVLLDSIGAEDAQGSGSLREFRRYGLLQGLKPNVPIRALIGPTKVVPLLQSVREWGSISLSKSLRARFLLLTIYGILRLGSGQAVEAMPFQGANIAADFQADCTPPEQMKAQLAGKPSAEALRDLGLWYAEKSQYACAAGAFGSSLQTDPNQKDVAHITFMFGVSMDLSGDSQGAIGALKEAEQLGYRDIKLHLMLAATLDATHSAKDAEEEWRAALQMDPEYTAALDALSNDLLKDGDFARVIALLEAPRLKGQRTALQSLNLAAAYEGSGKLEEARDVLRDGLNTTPDSLPLANELAKMLVALNDKAGAGRVLYLAGVQQMSKGALEEARGLFERAVGLGDSSADLQDALIKAKAAQAGK